MLYPGCVQMFTKTGSNFQLLWWGWWLCCTPVVILFHAGLAKATDFWHHCSIPSLLFSTFPPFFISQVLINEIFHSLQSEQKHSCLTPSALHAGLAELRQQQMDSYKWPVIPHGSLPKTWFTASLTGSWKMSDFTSLVFADWVWLSVPLDWCPASCLCVSNFNFC